MATIKDTKGNVMYDNPNKDERQLLTENRDNLENADLHDLDLSGIELDNAKLKGADLSGVDLSYSSMKNADLSETSINDANLYWTDFEKAVFDGANIFQTDLGNCNLTRASMKDVDVSGSTDFRGAVLSGTIFDDSVLRSGVLLEGTVINTKTSFRNTSIDLGSIGIWIDSDRPIPKYNPDDVDAWRESVFDEDYRNSPILRRVKKVMTPVTPDDLKKMGAILKGKPVFEHKETTPETVADNATE